MGPTIHELNLSLKLASTLVTCDQFFSTPLRVNDGWVCHFGMMNDYDLWYDGWLWPFSMMDDDDLLVWWMTMTF